MTKRVKGTLHPRPGPTCTSRRNPRADASLRCMKRPKHQGLHVSCAADGVIEWWGGTRADVAAELALLAKRTNGANEQAVFDIVTSTIVSSTAIASGKELALAKGFTGEQCSKCGSLDLIRTGTCSTCTNCGEPGSCG